MADLKSFLEFDSKRPEDWTKEIDLSVFGKMKKALDTVRNSALQLSKELDMDAPLESVLDLLHEVNKNYDAIGKRSAELSKTADSFRRAAAKSNSAEDKDALLQKAKAAEYYGEQLYRALRAYNELEVAAKKTKNGVRARDIIWDEKEKASKPSDRKENIETEEAEKKLEKLQEDAKKANDDISKDVSEEKKVNVDTKEAEKSLESLGQKFEDEHKEEQRIREAASAPEKRDADTDKSALEQLVDDYKTKVSELASASKEGSADALSVQQVYKGLAKAVYDLRNEYALLNSQVNIAKGGGKVFDAKGAETDLQTVEENAKNVGQAISDLTALQAKLKSELPKTQNAPIASQTIETDIDVDFTPTEQKVDSLKEKAKEVGQNIRQSVGDAIEQTASELRGNDAEIAASSQEYNTTLSERKARLEEIKAQLEALAREEREVGSAMEEAAEKGEATEQFEARINAIRTEMGSLTREFNSLKGKPVEKKAETRKLDTTYAATKTDEELKDDIEAAQQRIREIKEEGKAGLSTEQILEKDRLDEYIEALEKILEHRKELAKANKPSGSASKGPSGSGQVPSGGGGRTRVSPNQQSQRQAIQNAQTQVVQTKNLNDVLRETLAIRLRLAGAKVALPFSSDVMGDVKNIRGMSVELKNLQTIMNTMSSNALSTAFKNIGSAAGTAMKNVGSNVWNGIKTGATASLSALQGLASRGFSALRSGASALASGLAGLASKGFNAMKSAASSALNVVSTLASKGFGALRSAVSAVGAGLSSLASKGMNAVKNGANNIKNRFMGLVGQMTNFSKRHAPNMLRSLNGIKSMFMRRVKRTFISSIFEQARNGIQQLARYSSAFNASMSAIKNASKETAGNLSVTMGNLVNMIAPALTTVLGWISKVIQAVNAMFSLLSGKGTVTVAKKSTDNYAKSLSKASGAAKDLNHQLYGFDELTRQDDDSNSGGGGGSGAGNIKYEEKKISDVLDAQLMSMMDNIKNGKWREAGEILGKYLNQYIQIVDDKLIEWRGVSTKWAKNIAQFGNGLVEGLDFELIGKTIGDGFNLVFDTVNTFLKEFDFVNLGVKLGQGIMGTFNAIEWDLLGETFANGLNAVFGLAYGLVDAIDWGSIGDDFATALTSFYKNIKWENVRGAVTKGINGVVEALTSFVTKVPYKRIARDLFTNLRLAIEGIKWDNIGNLIATGINSFVDIFDEFTDSGVLKSFGDGIFTALETSIARIDFKKLSQALLKRMDVITSALEEWIQRANFPKLATRLASGINSMFNGGLISSAFDKATSVITLGTNQLIEAFSKITDRTSGINFDKIGEEIGAKLGNLLTGIDWEKLASALANGITGAFSGINQAITSFPWNETASVFAKSLTKFAKTIDWSGFGATVSNGLNSLIGALTTFVENIPYAAIASEMFSSLSAAIADINWEELGNLVSDGISNIETVFSEFVNSDVLKNLGIGIGTALGTALGSIDYEGKAEIIRTGIVKLVEAFGEIVDKIDFPNIATKIADGINTFFDTENGGKAFDGAVSSISEWVNKLNEGFGALLTGIDFAGIASSLATSINGLIAQTDLDGIVTNVGTFVTNTSTAFLKLLSEIDFTHIATELSAGINKLFAPEEDGGVDALTQLGTSASEAINNVIDAFKKLLDPKEGINFETIRQGFENGIKAIFYDTDVEGLITTIGHGITAATTEFFKLIGNIFSPEEGDDLGTRLANGINGIFRDANGDVDYTQFNKLGESIGDAIKNIFSNIQNFFEEADWLAIGTSIGEALGSIDWVGIAGNIVHLLWDALNAAVALTGGLLGGFIRKLFGIENYVESFDATASEWAKQFGDSFDNSIITEFQNGDRTKNIATVAALAATGLNDAFLGELNTQESYARERMNTIMNNLYADAEQACVNEGKDFDGDLFWTTISDAIASGDRATIISALEQFGLDANEATINGLLAGRDNLSEAGRTLMATLQSLGEGATLEQVKQAFRDAGIEVTDEFASAVGGTGTANMAAALLLLGSGIDQATIAALDTTNLSDNLSKYMEENGYTIEQVVAGLLADSGASLEEIALALGRDVGEELGFEIPKGTAEGLGKGKELVKDATEEVKNAGKIDETQKEEMEKSGAEAGGGVTKNIEETMDSGKADVTTSSEGVASAVEDPLSKLPEDVQPYAKEMMDYMIEGIQNGDPLVASAIETAANAVVQKAQEILASTVGYDIAVGFVGGIQSGLDFSGVESAMLSHCTQALMYANSSLSEKNGKSIGSNMIIGMINGMNAYGQTLVDTIAHICNVSAETARAILGIASPSKVFAEIGAYTMEGMQIGLQKSGDDAIDTVAGVADAIVEEAENGDTISMKVNAMTNGLDVVEGKMSRIAEIFSAIADTITEMGGFEIPTVASGRVLPYRAKVDAEPNVTTNNVLSDRNALEDSLYSAFMRAMGNADNEQVVRVYLDGREITDAVTKYQRQQQRAWGV